MAFPEYTPTPTQLVTLAEADDDEPLAAATTNASLEQLADGIAYTDATVDAVATSNAGKVNRAGDTMAGTLGFVKTRVQTQTPLSDANHNLDVNSTTNRVIMRTPPTGTRTLTLLKASASPAPVAGDWFEVTVLLSTSAFGVRLVREGASGGDSIAVIGDGAGVSPYALNGLTGTALVIYDGTEWRLASAGGVVFFGVDA